MVLELDQPSSLKRNLQLDVPLGEGGFGPVRRARDKETHAEYACPEDLIGYTLTGTNPKIIPLKNYRQVYEIQPGFPTRHTQMRNSTEPSQHQSLAA